MSEKRIKIFITISAVIFAGIVLILVIYNNVDKTNSVTKTEEKNIDDKGNKYIKYKGIIIDIDDTGKIYTVRDYNSINELEFEYKIGCEIKNKYGEDIHYDKLKIGDVVVVGYDKVISDLEYIHIDDSILRFNELKKFELNTDTYYIELDDEKYKLTKETFVYCEGKEYSIYDINENDVLSLSIKNNDILSVVINRSHGKVTLANYESLLGSHIIVNDDKSYEITRGLVLNVPEGKNVFTIKSNKMIGTTTLNIIRGYDRVIDMNKINFEKRKEGKVKFIIEPTNARLYIDGKPYNYEENIILDYGKHKYVVESAGYNSYASILDINKDLLEIAVRLYEKKNTEKPESTKEPDDKEEGTASAIPSVSPSSTATIRPTL